MGGSVFLAAFSGFLRCHEVGIGERLGFNLLAVEQVEQLREEHVEGTTIDHEVMHVHHQVNPLLGRGNFYVVERSLPQIERLDEFPLVLGHVFLLVLALGDFDRLVEVHNLDDFASFASEMSLQHGVRLDERLHCLDKQRNVHVFGETGDDRRVVDGGFGIFDRVHIDTHLCV